jgi:hypothetical protein
MMQTEAPKFYPTGLLQSNSPQKGKGKLFAIGCGVLLLLAACVILAYFLIRNPPTKESGKLIGGVDVGATGSVFTAEGVSIYFPAVSSASSEHFDIRLVDSGVGDDEVELRSKGYVIDGPLHLLTGEMNIVMEAPDGVDLDTSVVMIAEEQVYAPSYGDVTSLTILPTLIDANTRRLQATLFFQPVTMLENQKVASIGLPAVSRQESIPNNTITVRYEKGRFTDSLTSQHFQVSYHAQTVRRDLVKQALSILETQHSTLLRLGFHFGGVNPIPVNLMPLKDKAGQFVPSKFGIGYATLEIASRYFYTQAGFSDNVADLTATIGHEMMHFAQFAMDPRWAYTKATNPIATQWMDEATSTWFETTINSTHMMPKNAVDNVNSIYDPLFGVPLAAAQNHGYGSSFFMTYLVNSIGEQIVGDIYKALGKTSSSTAAEALDTTLKTYGTNSSIEWVKFLEVLEVMPYELAGFGGKNYRNLAVLEAGEKDSSGNVAVKFNVNSALQNHVQTTPGFLSGSENATLSASFELGGLAADELYISIKKDGPSATAFLSPGQIVITVDAPAGAGVLVYGVTSAKSIIPLAGAPLNYLSYGDPMTTGGYKLFVDNFSLEGSLESYSGILLVPFNNKSTSYTSGDPVAHITINLWYWGEVLPLGVTPTADFPIEGFGPTPTAQLQNPTDSGASDHACAGMTLDKMRQPSVLNKQCWTACFGIGSSTPSDSEILDCIAKHQ